MRYTSLLAGTRYECPYLTMRLLVPSNVLTRLQLCRHLTAWPWGFALRSYGMSSYSHFNMVTETTQGLSGYGGSRVEINKVALLDLAETLQGACTGQCKFQEEYALHKSEMLKT